MRYLSIFFLLTVLMSCETKVATVDAPVVVEKAEKAKAMAMAKPGIITKTSNQGFEETYSKLRGIIENNPNLKIILELDHSKNAASVDLKLNPTRIIMFGNPKLGTPLMNTTSYLGLDLPQKILVTQSAGGKVEISYNDPMYLKDRHKIVGVEEVLAKVSGALNKISDGALNP